MPEMRSSAQVQPIPGIAPQNRFEQERQAGTRSLFALSGMPETTDSEPQTTEIYGPLRGRVYTGDQKGALWEYALSGQIRPTKAEVERLDILAETLP
jgi:hypothetical protein